MRQDVVDEKQWEVGHLLGEGVAEWAFADGCYKKWHGCGECHAIEAREMRGCEMDGWNVRVAVDVVAERKRIPSRARIEYVAPLATDGRTI